MNITPAIAKRIAISKGVGFLFGPAGLISLPYFWPDADWMIRWGILLWYTTLGVIVGIFGVSTRHQILKMDLRWWVLAPFLGAWMNFVLTLFAYDKLAAIMASTFGVDGFPSSPFWFAAEGAVVGLIIAFFTIWFSTDD